MVLVNSVGVPEVLNRRPFTDMVSPTASEVWLGNSSKFISGSIWTVIVVLGGVAPVNKGESFVSVKVPFAEFMLPTCPVICDGHKRTRAVLTGLTPPAHVTAPRRVSTSW